MKHRKMVMSLLPVAVLTEAVGAVLNRIVISANGGMPTIACTGAFNKWVSLTQETKLAFLSDVIRVGNYAISVGDLFIITGIVTNMITIWIAMPQGRKFFPLLIASVIGIFMSIAEPNHLVSTLLFETAAIVTILAIYWKYRSTLKTKAVGTELDPHNSNNLN
jgi:hypothetical protein